MLNRVALSVVLLASCLPFHAVAEPLAEKFEHFVSYEVGAATDAAKAGWSVMTEVKDGVASKTTEALSSGLENAQGLIFSFLKLSEEMVSTRELSCLSASTYFYRCIHFSFI